MAVTGVLMACALVMCAMGRGDAMRPDEVSSFFLKAPKSVPRAGRAAPGQFESFFLKASKSVPRVGRRDGSAMESYSPYEQGLRDLLYGPENRKPTMDSYQSASDNYNNYSPEYSQYYRTPTNTNSYYRGNDYTMATFPTQLNDDNINHRSRRYNQAPLTHDMISDTQETNGSNLMKELEESRYQKEV